MTVKWHTDGLIKRYGSPRFTLWGYILFSWTHHCQYLASHIALLRDHSVSSHSEWAPFRTLINQPVASVGDCSLAGCVASLRLMERSVGSKIFVSFSCWHCDVAEFYIYIIHVVHAYIRYVIIRFSCSVASYIIPMSMLRHLHNNLTKIFGLL